MSQKFYVTLPYYVSHETIDDETIVIDLDKGHYYSLRHLASSIWNALTNQMDIDTITCAISSRFDVSREKLEKDVQEFIEELKKEGLVILEEGNSHDTGAAQDITINDQEYCKPEISKFTDMEDLLLLDPIHETDEHGWPRRPTAENVTLC